MVKYCCSSVQINSRLGFVLSGLQAQTVIRKSSEIILTIGFEFQQKIKIQKVFDPEK
jgi:hypothetical protein